jgi:glycosyltransferase involved in cell wall biosynthesis
MIEAPRVALVHDWLTERGGAEKTLETVLGLFPGSPVYTLFYQPKLFADSPIAQHPVSTSFLDRLPGARKRYRSLLPLMPLAVEQFDLRGYEVVVSIHDAVSHGVLVRPGQLHIDYILTPMRYIWALHQEYLRSPTLRSPIRSIAFRLMAHYLRIWDTGAAQRVDHFVAISHWVAQRVWRTYRRRAEVIYPPVEVERFRPATPREEYFLTVCRLVPYKRVPVLVEAFNRLDRPLLVVGDGPERRRLEAQAGPNVRFLGWVTEERLADLLSRARAFVFAAEEEFGIAAVEAQAAGCPVIAYGRGGLRETVVEGTTGHFFPDPTADSLIDAVRNFESRPSVYEAGQIRENALRFGRKRFEEEFRRMLDEQWERFRRDPEGVASA